MELQEYQQHAKRFILPQCFNLTYLILGLASEAGEVAGKYKKCLRGDGTLDVDALALEMGDVLWYLAMIAIRVGVSLDEIGNLNIDKLEQRLYGDKIQGDGDFR